MFKKLLLPAVVCCALLLSAALTHFSKAAETIQVGDGATTQVLIQEIRALRQTLEESTISNHRVQIAVERCRIQQAYVERLSDEFNSIQAQLETHHELLQQLEATIKTNEGLLSSETDSTRRAEIEREQKVTIANTDQNKQRIQRLQERSIQVNGLLTTERAKLGDFKDLLDEIDRQTTERSKNKR